MQYLRDQFEETEFKAQQKCFRSCLLTVMNMWKKQWSSCPTDFEVAASETIPSRKPKLKVEACLPIIDLLIDGLVRRMRRENINTTFLTEEGDSVHHCKNRAGQSMGNVFLLFSALWLEKMSCLWMCVFLSTSETEESMSVSRLYSSVSSFGISCSLELICASGLFLSGCASMQV